MPHKNRIAVQLMHPVFSKKRKQFKMSNRNQEEDDASATTVVATPVDNDKETVRKSLKMVEDNLQVLRSLSLHKEPDITEPDTYVERLMYHSLSGLYSFVKVIAIQVTDFFDSLTNDCKKLEPPTKRLKTEAINTAVLAHIQNLNEVTKFQKGNTAAKQIQQACTSLISAMAVIEHKWSSDSPDTEVDTVQSTETSINEFPHPNVVCDPDFHDIKNTILAIREAVFQIKGNVEDESNKENSSENDADSKKRKLHLQALNCVSDTITNQQKRQNGDGSSKRGNKNAILKKKMSLKLCRKVWSIEELNDDEFDALSEMIKDFFEEAIPNVYDGAYNVAERFLNNRKELTQQHVAKNKQKN